MKWVLLAVLASAAAVPTADLAIDWGPVQENDAIATVSIAGWALWVGGKKRCEFLQTDWAAFAEQACAGWEKQHKPAKGDPK